MEVEGLKLSLRMCGGVVQTLKRAFITKMRTCDPELLCIKGGPEPLEKEINEILGSKREDRLFDPFFEMIQIPLWFVFRTCFASAISVRPRGTCESSRRSARR